MKIPMSQADLEEEQKNRDQVLQSREQNEDNIIIDKLKESEPKFT